jgi:hypothetical protein
MPHPRPPRLAVALVIALSAGGCPTKPGTGDAAATDAAAETDTLSGDGAVLAGDGASAGPTTCSTLANGGEPAPEVAGQGEFPVAAGGAVKEGVYHLVRFEIFAPELADPIQRKETITIAGNTFTWAAQDPDGSVSRTAGTWVGEQVQLHLTVTCPADATPTTINVPYTATPIELRLFDTTDDNREIHVYARE